MHAELIQNSLRPHSVLVQNLDRAREEPLQKSHRIDAVVIGTSARSQPELTQNSSELKQNRSPYQGRPNPLNPTSTLTATAGRE